MSLRKVIATNVRAARIAAGFTQEELAKKAKVNVQHLSRIEREGSNVTIEIVEALAKALQISTNEILHTKAPKPPARSALDKFDEAVRLLQSYRIQVDPH